MKHLFLAFASAFCLANVQAQEIGTGASKILETDNLFNTKLKSGIYTSGKTQTGYPSGTNAWRYLFSMTQNKENLNQQFQISSDILQNDRMFFRKISNGDLTSPVNSAWYELATRGVNTFTGHQTIKNGYIYMKGGDASINMGESTSSGTRLRVILNTTYNEATIQYYPKMYIAGGDNRVMTFSSSGKIGINNQSPSEKVDIIGDVKLNGNLTFPELKRITLGEYGSTEFLRMSYDATYKQFVLMYRPSMVFWNAALNSETMRITAEGRVSIGYYSPREKLDVNGTIRAKGLKLETINWSDFVFDEAYELPSLSEVESFIKENKHLPGIPTEKEVMENGVNVGEVQAKLLQKVEELTLYVIELKKEIEVLKSNR